MSSSFPMLKSSSNNLNDKHRLSGRVVTFLVRDEICSIPGREKAGVDSQPGRFNHYTIGMFCFTRVYATTRLSHKPINPIASFPLKTITKCSCTSSASSGLCRK